jgi:hypothetical protein
MTRRKVTFEISGTTSIPTIYMDRTRTTNYPPDQKNINMKQIWVVWVVVVVVV